MTQLAQQLLDQAMQLSPDEREGLADQLYLSLHATAEPQEEVHAAWSEELARRLEEVDAGKVNLLSVQEVHQSIREILNAE
jgi:putative addiction module component (TIGR02574 family)